MHTSTRQISISLGALEASVTYFACEDFEDLLATFGSAVISWPVDNAELDEIVLVSRRLYSVLNAEGGDRALLTQCDVISRFCKQVQTKMFEISVHSDKTNGHHLSQDWISELRLAQRDLSKLAVSRMRKVELMSTLDASMDIDAFKAVRSAVHHVDMIVGIVDNDYSPMENVEEYFAHFIDVPMTPRKSVLSEIALAFHLAGKNVPHEIQKRISANEVGERR